MRGRRNKTPPTDLSACNWWWNGSQRKLAWEIQTRQLEEERKELVTADPSCSIRAARQDVDAIWRLRCFTPVHWPSASLSYLFTSLPILIQVGHRCARYSRALWILDVVGKDVDWFLFGLGLWGRCFWTQRGKRANNVARNKRAAVGVAALPIMPTTPKTRNVGGKIAKLIQNKPSIIQHKLIR